MRMLTSRTLTRPPNSRPTKPRSCVSVPDASRAVLSPVVSLKFPPPALREGRDLRRRCLHNLLHFGVALEARLSLEVAVHRLWCNEDEACVCLRRPRYAA